MTDEKIARINELAKKSKLSPLSKEELHEQALLRREYIDGYKKNLANQLDNAYVLDNNGNEQKLHKKKQ
ncbi:MAG: DUF896 domain-containing protein [Clostridia bacterium]